MLNTDLTALLLVQGEDFDAAPWAAPAAWSPPRWAQPSAPIDLWAGLCQGWLGPKARKELCHVDV